MFSLFDSRTGQPGQVTPARRGLLATYLVSPAGAHPAGTEPAGPGPAGAGPAGAGPAGAGPAGVGPDDLRAALVADLIRRVAERHHLLVTAWQRDPAAGDPGDPGAPGHGDGPGAATAFRLACDALNIHPAQLSEEPPDPLDVQVAGEPPTAGARWLRPAGVSGGGLPEGGLPEGGARPAALAERGLDPLALRLLLLRRHHQQPVPLSWDAARGADQALRRWREQAAGWARSPSKPMCAQYVAGFTAAFDDDLDTPAALALLDTLAADEEIPPGSKFEAFAHFDHLLGLDLAREVGR